MVLGKLEYCTIRFFGKSQVRIKISKTSHDKLSRNGFHMMQIRLEPRDVARLSSHGNNVCRKCTIPLIEGDIVVRIGARPPKYYHKECFKVY
jgi:hypothetical protein